LPQKQSQPEREHTIAQTDRRVEHPPMFRVVMHNDDYTSQNFVVVILQEIFHRAPADAARIMLEVHTRGFGVAGTYPYEIAETKVHRVHELAMANGFPLKCSIEAD